MPKDERVVYRGVVSFDEAGTGSGSVLYPAPNVGGLLAAVLTHGFLVDSTKKEQKDKLQASADSVLSPYKVILDSFSYRELMRKAVERTSNGANAKFIKESDDPGNAVVVESAPIFSLTQDQKAIILDNTIIVHRLDSTPAVTYRHMIRVVSNPRDVAEPAVFWTANDGERLREESAQLVAESFDIAFRRDADDTDRNSLPYRTIRYREGGAEKFERAQVLDDRCDRQLIRTLRGSLMSIPVSRSETETTDRCVANGAR